MQTLTTCYGLKEGDEITMPMRLTLWQRFLIWLYEPPKWPPRIADRTFVVTAIESDTFSRIEYVKTVLGGYE